MSSIKKLKANPDHLNNFMSSDKRSGNNPFSDCAQVNWPITPEVNDTQPVKDLPRQVVLDNSQRINIGLN